MLRVIKKILIIILLVMLDTIYYLTTSIYVFLEKNKSKIKKYSKSFYSVLKEELDK